MNTEELYSSVCVQKWLDRNRRSKKSFNKILKGDEGCLVKLKKKILNLVQRWMH